LYPHPKVQKKKKKSEIQIEMASRSWLRLLAPNAALARRVSTARPEPVDAGRYLQACKPLYAPRKVLAGAQNRIEKLAQRARVSTTATGNVAAGDFIYIKPDHVMTHDNTSAVMSK
jgi:homoaconitate hydratase